MTAAIDLRIVNIVAMAPLMGLPFDELRSTLSQHGVLDDGKSVWLSTHWPPQGFYAAFYKSGKVLTPGSKTLQEVQERFDLIQTRLTDWKTAGRIGTPAVQNLVVMGRIPLTRSLDFLTRSNLPYALSYEPEQFPALHIAMDGATFLLYNSGSFVLTGTRDIVVARDRAVDLLLHLEALGAA